MSAGFSRISNGKVMLEKVLQVKFLMAGDIAWPGAFCPSWLEISPGQGLSVSICKNWVC